MPMVLQDMDFFHCKSSGTLKHHLIASSDNDRDDCQYRYRFCKTRCCGSENNDKYCEFAKKLPTKIWFTKCN